MRELRSCGTAPLLRGCCSRSCSLLRSRSHSRSRSHVHLFARACYKTHALVRCGPIFRLPSLALARYLFRSRSRSRSRSRAVWMIVWRVRWRSSLKASTTCRLDQCLWMSFLLPRSTIFASYCTASTTLNSVGCAPISSCYAARSRRRLKPCLLPPISSTSSPVLVGTRINNRRNSTNNHSSNCNSTSTLP